jgi:hypothetical protein
VLAQNALELIQKEWIMPMRKIPLAASQHGIAKGKGSLTKLIRVTGIPGLPILELSGRRKLSPEIRSGEELLVMLNSVLYRAGETSVIQERAEKFTGRN